MTSQRDRDEIRAVAEAHRELMVRATHMDLRARQWRMLSAVVYFTVGWTKLRDRVYLDQVGAVAHLRDRKIVGKELTGLSKQLDLIVYQPGRGRGKQSIIGLHPAGGVRLPEPVQETLSEVSGAVLTACGQPDKRGSQSDPFSAVDNHGKGGRSGPEKGGPRVPHSRVNPSKTLRGFSTDAPIQPPLMATVGPSRPECYAMAAAVVTSLPRDVLDALSTDQRKQLHAALAALAGDGMTKQQLRGVVLARELATANNVYDVVVARAGDIGERGPTSTPLADTPGEDSAADAATGIWHAAIDAALAQLPGPQYRRLVDQARESLPELLKNSRDDSDVVRQAVRAAFAAWAQWPPPPAMPALTVAPDPLRRLGG